MSLPAQRAATWQDLAAIPEARRRHEVVAGELVEKDAASAKHGAAQLSLGSVLRPGGGGPGGWWFASEVEIELATHEIYRPDVAGWRRERLPALPEEVPIRVRPDWICEILSSNRRHDVVKKKRGYHGAAVPHYWLLDPASETLTVLRWTADGYLDVLDAARGDQVRAEPFDDIEFDLGVSFGDDDVP